MQNEKKEKRILYLILFLEILLLVYVTWRWGANRIDSDDSAEMMLAELLSRDGGILSRNWYYSTELRVLNTQIIMSFLFRYISDWHTVRVLGTGIHLVILTMSYLFLCGSVPENRKLRLWAPVILLPFSYVYYDIVLFGLHYVANLCIIFVSLGLIVRDLDGIRSYIRTAVLILLAFTAGLAGLRIPAIGYFPMFLAGISVALLKKNTGILYRTLFAGIASAAGWLVNSRILSKYYTFVLWNQTRLTLPQSSRIVEVLRDTLGMFSVSRPALSLTGIATLAGIFVFLITIVSLWRIIKERRTVSTHVLFIVFFSLWSWLTTAGIGICTTQPWANRYMIMPCIGFIVILSEGIPLIRHHTLRKVLCAGCACSLLFCGATQYRIFIGNDKFKYSRNAVNYVLNSGMRFGFGDWDVSDSLTEISDGSVHVCKLHDLKDTAIWYWLMEKDYQKYAGDGPIFFLIATNRLNFSGDIGHVSGEWTEENLKWLEKGELSYEDNRYRVYTFPSLEYFQEITNLK